MLYAHLRSPSPEIVRLGEGRVTQRSKGGRRKGREKGNILPGDNGSPGPIQAHRGGTEAYYVAGAAVRDIGESSHEVKVDVGAGLGAGQTGTIDFQPYFRLPHGGPDASPCTDLTAW